MFFYKHSFWKIQVVKSFATAGVLIWRRMWNETVGGNVPLKRISAATKDVRHSHLTNLRRRPVSQNSLIIFLRLPKNVE